MSKFRVEMPNTDARRILNNMDEVREFLNSYNVTFFLREGNVITVPAFAEGRRKYSEMKARDCARWGCE